MIDLRMMEEVLLGDGNWRKVDRGTFKIAEYKIGVAEENKVQFDGRTEEGTSAKILRRAIITFLRQIRPTRESLLWER